MRLRMAHVSVLCLICMTGWANPPETPRGVDPPNNGKTTSAAPTLYSTLYQDLNFSRDHMASQWQVTKTSGDYSSPVFDLTSSQFLTECPIPPGTLRDTVRYYWRVRHQGDDGEWSEWSCAMNGARPFLTGSVAKNRNAICICSISLTFLDGVPDSISHTWRLK